VAAGIAACRDVQPTASRAANPLTLTSSASRVPQLRTSDQRSNWAVQRTVTTTPGENGTSMSNFDGEEAPIWQDIGDFYADYGVHFENAMGIILPPSSYYPPNSPSTLITAIIPPDFTGGDGHVTITFDFPVTVFGAYATSAMPLALSCSDSTGAIVDTKYLRTPNLNNGESPFGPNQNIEVRGEGIVRCVFDGSNNLYGFDDFYFSRLPQPKLTVNCDPDSPMPRGEWVRCIATLEPKKTPFTIIERRAEAEGHVYTDTTAIPVNGERGDYEYSWAGNAVVDTKVTMKARVAVGGDTVTVTSEAVEFSVKSRMDIGSESWPRLTLPDTAPTPQVDTAGRLTFPPFQSDSIKVSNNKKVSWYTAAAGALGLTTLTLKYPYEHLIQGPNTNWLYIRDSVTISENSIVYSKHLDSTDSFYTQQTGGTVVIAGKRYTGCGSADMQSLRNQTFTHERGHYAVNKNYFAAHDVQGAFEGIRVYVDTTVAGAVTTRDALRLAVASAYAAPLDSLQKPLDDRSVTPYPINLSCFFHGPFPGVK
jgi:hypothetical protein